MMNPEIGVLQDSEFFFIGRAVVDPANIITEGTQCYAKIRSGHVSGPRLWLSGYRSSIRETAPPVASSMRRATSGDGRL